MKEKQPKYNMFQEVYFIGSNKLKKERITMVRLSTERAFSFEKTNKKIEKYIEYGFGLCRDVRSIYSFDIKKEDEIFETKEELLESLKQ